VKVFELVTSSRDHLDADPELEHDEIETRVLRVGKTETNGLPDLEISETLTTMKERRSQRKRSRMRAVWNGEGYDVCPAKLDQSAHCGACGHRCAVGEGCCGQRCVVLQSAAHCGACNHSCRSVGGGSVPFCADPAKGRCELACTANAFDLDGRDDNGCEYSAKNEGHSTEATAIDRGSRRCSDADSRDQLTAELVSDLRRHAPAGATGPLELVRAAPVYVRAKAEGGALCQNDLEATLRVAGPAADVPCYRLTVRTDRGQRSVSVRAGGEATIRAGRGAYTSGATVLFKIEQRCQPTQPQATQITLSYHL
jgi:hypothetical protein